MDRNGAGGGGELGCGVARSGQVVSNQMHAHHGRPADPPESRGSLMMIDSLAPATSVSSAHLANSPISMGRPSPYLHGVPLIRSIDTAVVSDRNINPRSKHL